MIKQPTTQENINLCKSPDNKTTESMTHNQNYEKRLVNYYTFRIAILTAMNKFRSKIGKITGRTSKLHQSTGYSQHV